MFVALLSGCSCCSLFLYSECRFQRSLVSTAAFYVSLHIQHQQVTNKVLEILLRWCQVWPGVLPLHWERGRWHHSWTIPALFSSRWRTPSYCWKTIVEQQILAHGVMSGASRGGSHTPTQTRDVSCSGWCLLMNEDEGFAFPVLALESFEVNVHQSQVQELRFACCFFLRH